MLDFEDYSLTQPAMLVTIVTEAALQASLEKLLKNLKVYGYSVSAVPGAVKRLPQLGQFVSEDSEETGPPDEADYAAANLEIRAVVSPELSNVILYALKDQQRQFPILVYRQKVDAVVESV
jgi:hypothetical protein